MTVPIRVQQTVNEAVSGIHQCRDPLTRARKAGELTEYLQRRIDELAKTRRKAVAEAVQRPDMSMAKVASELDLSKSTVAKLCRIYADLLGSARVA
jgi:transcriptional regulator with PAS, ATPase and Fis domain